MEIDRLKGLAAHLRSIVSTTPLSHGQALDLIAALPGLRNWPEVMAFPERVAACELDEVSVERLARRLEPVWVRARVASLLYLLEQAEFQAVTPRRHGTERLIITTSDSGAGHVKAARMAD
ncbi:MAG TPA: hypothetical protein VH328_06910, partial [Burkholderiaceae bacterium]|nr:hypothetical protein [Burkholderiaceae bacterium]